MTRVPTRNRPVRSGVAGAIALLLAAGAVAQQPSGNQVYRYEDAQGRIVYSDRPPPPDAKKAEAKRVAGTKPSLPLAAYTGTYSDPLYGDVVVSLDGARLKVGYGTAYVGTLEHWHYDTFQARWNAAWRGTSLVNFVLDEDGTPATVEAMGLKFTRAR